MYPPGTVKATSKVTVAISVVTIGSVLAADFKLELMLTSMVGTGRGGTSGGGGGCNGKNKSSCHLWLLGTAPNFFNVSRIICCHMHEKHIDDLIRVSSKGSIYETPTWRILKSLKFLLKTLVL